jgi:protein arginine kinase
MDAARRARHDVVLSSRVRLARNLRRYEFPHRATTSDLLTIRHRVWQGLHATGESSGGLSDARLLPFEEFTGWERQSLIDRYITSREHIAEEIGRGVAANADASLSVLVNEEDHIRLQSLLPGLQLDAAYHLVDRLDDTLESYFDSRGGFAYSDTFGYLTACPTNAGTGVRASVMLHLPGARNRGQIGALAQMGRRKAARFARLVRRRFARVGPHAPALESGDAGRG